MTRIWTDPEGRKVYEVSLCSNFQVGTLNFSITDPDYVPFNEVDRLIARWVDTFELSQLDFQKQFARAIVAEAVRRAKEGK